MMHREQVLPQALSRSPEDRAYVAALEDGPSVAPASPEAQEASSTVLLAELQRRSAAYQAGV